MGGVQRILLIDSISDHKREAAIYIYECGPATRLLRSLVGLEVCRSAMYVKARISNTSSIRMWFQRRGWLERSLDGGLGQ